jgi:serine/threonine-protein kinase ATR
LTKFAFKSTYVFLFFGYTQVDTAQIVHAILKRVLIRYPAQAMWPMAWIRKSENLERRQIGENIFRDAVQSFSNKQVSAKHSLDVLVTSKNLIDFLHGIATNVPSDSTKGKKMRIKPFKDLTEFVPPIQAALSVSLSCGDSSRVRDVFPRHVPRMRAFNEYVSVMMSKAKPKKLKVYVVSADTIARYRSNIVRELSSDHDIGEIHFLIKQEEKGDLRKDARVQDLNNLCNRIMSPSNSAKGLSNQTRRLHLRTFTVTCLSEDTGLLEWVPHTAALRSLIERTYNPQAPKLSSKRHGRRLTSFNDPQIRINFEKTVQNAFFVSGNLAKATELFEELCLRPHPPLLYWWFVQQFQDPHSWYDARTRFTVSAAVWSAIGHVIGLGDRHSENILVDSTTGDCVHVDFDWYVQFHLLTKSRTF